MVGRRRRSRQRARSAAALGIPCRQGRKRAALPGNPAPCLAAQPSAVPGRPTHESCAQLGLPAALPTPPALPQMRCAAQALRPGATQTCTRSLARRPSGEAGAPSHHNNGRLSQHQQGRTSRGKGLQPRPRHGSLAAAASKQAGAQHDGAQCPAGRFCCGLTTERLARGFSSGCNLSSPSQHAAQPTALSVNCSSAPPRPRPTTNETERCSKINVQSEWLCNIPLGSTLPKGQRGWLRHTRGQSSAPRERARCQACANVDKGTTRRCRKAQLHNRQHTTGATQQLGRATQTSTAADNRSTRYMKYG